MKIHFLLLMMLYVSAAYSLEHNAYISTYETHSILAEDVTAVEITISAEIQVDGCNDYSIDGNFNEVQMQGTSLYTTYLGEFSSSQTEILCDEPDPGTEILSKTFRFGANGNGTVGLRLIFPEGYSLSVKEIN